MIKPRRQPWPHPGDTALDRARHIARTYRNELARLDPHRASVLDDAFVRYGEPWITPQPGELDLNTTLPAPALSDYLGGDPTPATIRQWASRGHIPRHTDTNGRTVYRVGDILNHIATQRRARAERHSA